MTDNKINLSFGANKSSCEQGNIDHSSYGNEKCQKYWDNGDTVVCIFKKLHPVKLSPTSDTYSY